MLFEKNRNLIFLRLAKNIFIFLVKKTINIEKIIVFLLIEAINITSYKTLYNAFYALPHIKRVSI